ncbi:TPA: hypothetical protein OV554_003571 [Acinetobacter baumannii]|nr:hypothetical protein [Acinetobacter baumannii]
MKIKYASDYKRSGPAKRTLSNLFGLLNKEKTLTNAQKVKNAIDYANKTGLYYQLYWMNRHDTFLGFKGLYTSKLNNLYQAYLDLTDQAIKSPLHFGPVWMTELANIGIQLQSLMGNDERTQPKVLALHKRGLIKPDTDLFFVLPETIWFIPKRFAYHFDFNISKQDSPFYLGSEEPYQFDGHPINDILKQAMHESLANHKDLSDDSVEFFRDKTYRTIRTYMHRYNITVNIGCDWIEAFIACSKELNKIEYKMERLIYGLNLDMRDVIAEGIQGLDAKYISKALSKTLEELEKYYVTGPEFRAERYFAYFSSDTCEFISVGARGYSQKNEEIGKYPTFPKFEPPIRRGYAIPYELDKPIDTTNLDAVTNLHINEQFSLFTLPSNFIVTGKYKDFFKIAYCYEENGILQPRPIEQIYSDLRDLLPFFLKFNPHLALKEFGREVQMDEIGVQLVDGTINVVLWGYGNVDWIKVRS